MSDTEPYINEPSVPDPSRLIAERRLLAWVRTVFSMIAFGFGIYKFLQFMASRAKCLFRGPDAPRNVGLALMGIGTFAITIACIQHWKHLKICRQINPATPGT